MSKRALITGAGGFLGSNLALHLKDAGWTVWGTWHAQAPGLKQLEPRRLDICVPGSIAEVMDAAKPDAVFHLAALAEPDACAADEPAARQINVQGAKLMAQAAVKAGAAFIFTSTDQVFDGSKAFFTEEDAPRPLGAYGRSKRDAETAVLEATQGKALVLRLALTYGWGRGGAKGRNFAEKWLKTMLMGGRLQVFTDQWRTPIYSDDACEALRRGAEEGWSGLLHLAGSERATRADFATRLAKAFSFPEGALVPSSMADVVFKDPRPADASLGIAKLQGLGLTPRGIDAGLAAMHEVLEKEKL